MYILYFISSLYEKDEWFVDNVPQPVESSLTIVLLKKFSTRPDYTNELKY
jgi:hypothetical protein